MGVEGTWTRAERSPLASVTAVGGATMALAFTLRARGIPPRARPAASVDRKSIPTVAEGATVTSPGATRSTCTTAVMLSRALPLP